jgi:hypothetical protein
MHLSSQAHIILEARASRCASKTIIEEQDGNTTDYADEKQVHLPEEIVIAHSASKHCRRRSERKIRQPKKLVTAQTKRDSSPVAISEISSHDSLVNCDWGQSEV